MFEPIAITAVLSLWIVGALASVPFGAWVRARQEQEALRVRERTFRLLIAQGFPPEWIGGERMNSGMATIEER